MAHKKSTIVRIMSILATSLSRVAPGLAARWLQRLFLTPRNRRAHPREGRWLATARRCDLGTPDGSLAVYTWGAGPTVLLAHGWAGRAGQLGALVEPLVDRGYRVVAFDAPAHGASAGARTNLVQMSRAIASVAEHAGPVEAIVAHSLGTAACAVALGDGLPVERLVFVAPPDRPGVFLGWMGRFLGFSEAVVTRTRERIEAMIGRPFSGLNTVELAPRMGQPLLVLHDEDDRVVPIEQGRAVSAAWPGARLEVTTGLGHDRILRDQRVVEAIVDFVAPAEVPLVANAR